MKISELSPYFYQNEKEQVRLQNDGVVFNLAHDDDHLLHWKLAGALKRDKIPLYFNVFTQGQKGKINGGYREMDETIAIREAEFKNAMHALGIPKEQYNLFGFTDHEIDPQKAEKVLMQTLRSQKPAMVVAIHPFEITRNIQHADHNLVGQITNSVSEVLDSRNHFSEFPETATRPALVFWVTSKNLDPTHAFRLKDKDIDQRNIFAAAYYPSQFSGDMSWEQTLNESFYKNGKGRYFELYRRVR